MVARMDKLHPIVSGNKIFKLKYFLEDAVKHQRPVVTFGGAYSNHLDATAFACKVAGLESYGIVRGERPRALSHTLVNCMANGMQLTFLSRSAYAAIPGEASFEIPGIPDNALVIPEGGYHPDGARGAANILDRISTVDTDHIVLAVGTATTVAGILQHDVAGSSVIAVPVLKNFHDLIDRVTYLTGTAVPWNLTCWGDYHFGGYAKKNKELIQFMNELYTQHGIPTDFVYTAKMMFAVMDKIKSDYFRPGARILCLHTGGLQGNNSLAAGSLVF